MYRHYYQATVWAIVVVALMIPFQGHSSVSKQGKMLIGKWERFWREQTDREPSKTFPYEACFRHAAKTHGLPVSLLIAIGRGESDFDPTARSKADAYGIMQILWPQTARHLGITRLQTLLDPCTNIEAGARYLKEMLRRYDGDLHLAIAAYNYGPARIPRDRGSFIPKGARWYSEYIYRHLSYVLGQGKKGKANISKPGYGQDRKLSVIRFRRAYRASALVALLKRRSESLRIDWFKRPFGVFEVVLLYKNKRELNQGKRALHESGLASTWP